LARRRQKLVGKLPEIKKKFKILLAASTHYKEIHEYTLLIYDFL
jgi:hypothetical protein